MEQTERTIEIRGFLKLDAYLRKKYGGIPVHLTLEKPLTGVELAKQLGISLEDIEVIFVNRIVQAVDYTIHPGDRVAFLPPGCPGPYRIAFGFYGKNGGSKSNFKIQKKE